MNLKEDFNSFCKSASEVKYKANKFFFKYNKTIDVGYKIAKAVTKMATDKTPLALLEGAFEIVSGLGSSYYPESFFNIQNGWSEIKNLVGLPPSMFGKIFREAMADYKFTSIVFQQGFQNGKIYHTPVGDVGHTHTQYGDYKFYFRHESKEDEIVNFIIDNFIKTLNSNVLSISFSYDKLEIIPEDIFPVSSKTAVDFSTYIKKCLALGINRSFLFHGLPGTGKTTLSQFIINDLKFKTLKVRIGHYFKPEICKHLISKLNVDAVMIDDFDHSMEAESLLELLEFCKHKVKITIGTVNSLKKLHPAIVRPGRFDEIFKIESLDSITINNQLGDLHSIYGSKVNGWPIAYINELVLRSKLYSFQELEKHFEELQTRVTNQITELSDKK